jgi:phosphatidylglycerol:prolipoprotein diacylglycerol transferase
MTVPLVDPQYFWAAALLTGLAYAAHRAADAGLDPRRLYWAGVWGIAGGLWGSHVMVTVVYQHQWTFGALVPDLRAGKSSLGGLFAGAFCLAAFLRLRGERILPFLDASAPAVALAYAIARIGCFFNGDDFGTVSSVPWAVAYGPATLAFDEHVARGWVDVSTGVSLAVHPVQLYSALAALALFVLLRRADRQPQGRQTAALMIGYGVSRFCLEWMRGDFEASLGPLSVAQVCCVPLVAGGLAIAQRTWTRRATLIDASTAATPAVAR